MKLKTKFALWIIFVILLFDGILMPIVKPYRVHIEPFIFDADLVSAQR
jgi:hypothetical protein